jgi:hypothetical protein
MLQSLKKFKSLRIKFRYNQLILLSSFVILLEEKDLLSIKIRKKFIYPFEQITIHY